MDKVNQVIFYTIEKTIKRYKQMAQQNIRRAGLTITIDQWLILKTIQENPDISQQQIASIVFKDFASVTRMIELMVKNKHLAREIHVRDRRRFVLKITASGYELLAKVKPVVAANRVQALRGITKKETETLQVILNKISDNCG